MNSMIDKIEKLSMNKTGQAAADPVYLHSTYMHIRLCDPR